MRPKEDDSTVARQLVRKELLRPAKSEKRPAGDYEFRYILSRRNLRLRFEVDSGRNARVVRALVGARA